LSPRAEPPFQLRALLPQRDGFQGFFIQGRFLSFSQTPSSRPVFRQVHVLLFRSALHRMSFFSSQTRAGPFFCAPGQQLDSLAFFPSATSARRRSPRYLCAARWCTRWLFFFCVFFFLQTWLCFPFSRCFPFRGHALFGFLWRRCFGTCVLSHVRRCQSTNVERPFHFRPYAIPTGNWHRFLFGLAHQRNHRPFPFPSAIQPLFLPFFFLHRTLPLWAFFPPR